MIQTEAERQFYLGVTGIHLWYARAPLPGAAPSPAYDFGVVEAEAAPAVVADAPTKKRVLTARPSVDPANKDRLAQLKNMMESGASVAAPLARAEPEVEEVGEPEPARELPVEDAPEASPRVASPKDVARLCLQYWVGDRILLLANLSEEASFSMQEALAGNILRSLGEQAPGSSAAIRWPLFNNVRVSLNSDADLADLLRQSLAQASGKTVITLGLVSGVGSIPDLLADVMGREPDMAFGASLAALAGDPSLKRELWQKIRPMAAKA